MNRKEQLRQWRALWNETARKLRRKKRELGLCRQIMCTQPAKGWYCEKHQSRANLDRKAYAMARCNACGDMRKDLGTGICQTCTLLGRQPTGPTTTDWIRRVAQWRVSGLTRAEWCAEMGIDAAELAKWSEQIPVGRAVGEPREVWERRVADWKASGRTLKDYAIERGYNIQAMRRWAQKGKKHGKAK